MSRQLLRSTFVIVLFAGLLTARGATQGDAKDGDDQKMLQGTWAAVTVESRGARLSPEQTKKFQMQFKDDRLTIQRGDKTEEWTYELQPARMPKIISLTDKENNRRWGIYELTPDGLQMCFSGPKLTAPARFEAGHDLNVVLKKK